MFIVFLKQLLFTSLILGVFNLIPIPPLDGSWILYHKASTKQQEFIEKFKPYSFFVLLILVWTPIFDYLLAIPMGVFMMILYTIKSILGFA